MKKTIFVTLTILTLLFSFAPMSVALAKKAPTEVTLKVHNKTGGQVSLMLTNENGNPIFFEYGHGQAFSSLPEGKYTYYASTPCGNKSGEFNVNVTKDLFFGCSDGVDVTLLRTSARTSAPPGCGYYEYWHWFGSSSDGGHWHPHVDADYGGVQSDANGHWEERCADGAVIFD